MAFVKTTRTKAYFKRFQVKYARRRSGLTDYGARSKLIRQAKDKYDTPKYRLVVRFSNKRCLAQIVYASLKGDKVIAQADSLELGRYGLSVGLKNYSAAYCTGLLVGRRVLQKLKLDGEYQGNTEVDGEIVQVEDGKRTFFVDAVKERRPFRCFLDVGLKRTSLGSKVFGALKGAADAGLDIPHNYKKFPGYDKDDKKYDAEMHRAAIFGEPVKQYMEQLIDDDQESGTKRFKKHFGVYEAASIGPDDLEELYTKVHAAIRADPSPKHKESKKVRASKRVPSTKYKHAARKTREQRLADIKAKLAARDAARGDIGVNVSG